MGNAIMKGESLDSHAKLEIISNKLNLSQDVTTELDRVLAKHKLAFEFPGELSAKSTQAYRELGIKDLSIKKFSETIGSTVEYLILSKIFNSQEILDTIVAMTDLVISKNHSNIKKRKKKKK